MSNASSPMIFPASASVEEQNFNWPKIGEQSDQDFGITDLVDAPVSSKFGTRTILMNDKHEVCLVKSEKYGYLQIPGGGLESGETTIARITQNTRFSMPKISKIILSKICSQKFLHRMESLQKPIA